VIDLHTHLLPDWDDGARTWDDFHAMAAIACGDGIRTVVLTPHVFRLSRHDDDFGVLEARFARAGVEAGRTGLRILRGAEVFLQPDIVSVVRERRLTINGSNYFFVEFPEDTLPPNVGEIFFKIMLEGYTPVISHPERNAVFRERPGLLFDLVRAGGLAQVTAKSLTGGFGPETKRAAGLFLRHNLVQVIASDAHDARLRPPLLSAAVEEAGRAVGADKALAMVTEIPQAILDNKALPDWGEPEEPARKKKWMIRISRRGG
jgi:protein-tyrosine phosphatase